MGKLTGWRAVIVIIVMFAVPYATYKYVIAPWIGAWIAGKLPEVHSLQPAMEAKFPDKEVRVFDLTHYSSEPDGKQRVLAIAIVGKGFISQEQAAAVRTVVCSKLGDNKNKYDAIVLQSTIEKRFLVFFSHKHKAGKIDCDAPTEVPPAISSTPDAFSDGNFQLLPDSNNFMPGDTLNVQAVPDSGPNKPIQGGNFQPLPTQKYPDEYIKAFMAACTADGANTADACTCAVDSLMTSYSYKQAVELNVRGFSEEQVSNWHDGCYLSADGFDARDIKL